MRQVAMAEEDLADAYQMLEELGSTHLSRNFPSGRSLLTVRRWELRCSV
jgi:hypothetical protein